MSHLDAEALEELGHRGEDLVAQGLNLGDAGVGSRAMVPVLEHRFRLFASLLKATGDNLTALRRAESQHSFGGQGFGARDALPLNAYGPANGLAPTGLFDSFEDYAQDEAVDSIWPRGRMAQARARRDATSRRLTGLTGDQGRDRA